MELEKLHKLVSSKNYKGSTALKKLLLSSGTFEVKGIGVMPRKHIYRIYSMRFEYARGALKKSIGMLLKNLEKSTDDSVGGFIIKSDKMVFFIYTDSKITQVNGILEWKKTSHLPNKNTAGTL